jgi:glycosyltransferase involved in cell wall biosynthesis
MKKKILFTTGTFDIGGKERQLIEIIRSLPPEKYEIHLFVKKYYPVYYDQIKRHLKSFYSLDQKKRFHFSDISSLNKYLKKIKPDIAFSFASATSHFLLFLKYLCCYRFKLINGSIRNAPVVLSKQQKIERKLYDLYTYVVANSYAGLKAYNQHNKKGRFILYNGFNFNRIPDISKENARKLLNFPPNKFIVIMLARLDDQKDHATFIRACRLCSDESEDFKFYIIGDGKYYNKLIRFSNTMGLNVRLDFLGKRNDTELINIAADLSVLTSANGEGISNSIMEAMASCTPVIATDDGGTIEIMQNNHTGYTIKKGDYESLSERIFFLKSKPDLIKQLGRNGRTIIEQKFSLQRMITEFEEIIALP